MKLPLSKRNYLRWKRKTGEEKTVLLAEVMFASEEDRNGKLWQWAVVVSVSGLKGLSCVVLCCDPDSLSLSLSTSRLGWLRVRSVCGNVSEGMLPFVLACVCVFVCVATRLWM